MYVAGCRLGFSNRSRAVCVCVIVVATVITTLLTEVDVVISIRISSCVRYLIYVYMHVRRSAIAGRCYKHNFASYVVDKRISEDLLIDHTLDILSCCIVVSAYNVSNVVYLSLAFVKNDSLVLLIEFAELLLCLTLKLADLIHVAYCTACSGEYLYDANELAHDRYEQKYLPQAKFPHTP